MPHVLVDQKVHSGFSVTSYGKSWKIFWSTQYTISFHPPPHPQTTMRWVQFELILKIKELSYTSNLHNWYITLPTKVCLVKALVFPVVMYGCERWTKKKAELQRTDALNCGTGEGSWESLRQQGNQTGQSYRKSTLNIHWKDWCWSRNFNTLGIGWSTEWQIEFIWTSRHDSLRVLPGGLLKSIGKSSPWCSQHEWYDQ